MRLVVLGDLHFGVMSVWPWELVGKRFIGQMNLWFNRRRHFDYTLLEPTLERVRAIKPARVICTGDFTTTALDREFELAKRQVSPLLENFRGFVLPGNHDRYTFTSERVKRFEQHFGRWSAAAWPHYEQLTERDHFIALDVAKANALHDPGRVGETQLKALAALINTLPGDARLIVACHYTLGTPPGVHEREHHQLEDLAELVEVLRGERQTLFVHGHVHRPWVWRHAKAANVVTLNVGAPLMIGQPWPRGQGFWSVDPGSGANGLWRLSRHVMDGTGKWRSFDVPAPMEANQVAEIDPPDPDRPWGEPELQ
jgi:3',5'-cyclic AMP phosphodiesterase CpdA